jgi:hypothetical protein
MALKTHFPAKELTVGVVKATGCEATPGFKSWWWHLGLPPI